MTAAKFHRAQVGEMLKELYAATALKSLTLYGNPSVGKFIPSTPSTKGLRLLCHMHSSNHRFRRTSATGVSSTVPSSPISRPWRTLALRPERDRQALRARAGEEVFLSLKLCETALGTDFRALF